MTLLFGVSSVSAQQPESFQIYERAREFLEERGEVYFRFRIPKECTLGYFSEFVSIDHVSADTIYAYANHTGFERFLATGITCEVLSPPSLRIKKALFQSKKTGEWYNRYPTYTEYIDLIEGFAKDFPDLCTFIEYGRSVNEKKLLALKISDNAGTREKEPVLLYSSTVHGDEVLGYVLMLRLIETLLINYNTDPEIKRLVDNMEIWIIPLANPDGTYFLSDTSVTGATRFNANHIDLNRDFPDLRDKDYAIRYRQPETTAMMNFMKTIQVALAANFHSGAEVVNYPWDTWSRLHADDEWYKSISRAYADTVHIYSPAGYMIDLDNGITNGNAWYPIFGGRQDYTNYFLNAREVTIELSMDKMPAESMFDKYWEYNKHSLFGYMGQVLQGITGEVTDSSTGQPVKASIFIENHDFDNSYAVSSELDGSFYRLTMEGNFVFVFSASGYRTKRYALNVRAGELTHLDVRLVSSVECFEIYPNPFTDKLNIYISEPGDDIIIEFNDLSGRKRGFIRQPVLSGGYQEVPASCLAPGVYLVSVCYRNRIIRQVVFKNRD
jgi:hypothetical protein